MTSLRGNEPQVYAPEAGEPDAGYVIVSNQEGDGLLWLTPDYADQLADWLKNCALYARGQAKSPEAEAVERVAQVKAPVLDPDWS
jgi:hypothetical protein